MQTPDIAWGQWLFGLFCIACGLAYLFSARFSAFALTSDGRGMIWSKLLGPKWSMFAARWLFSVIAIGVGAFLVYIAFVPGH